MTKPQKNKMNMDQSKYDYLLENNKKYMNYIALSYENQKITYEELHDNINKYANVFYKIGIKSGDVVGVCVLNTPESIYILYALDVLGANVVGINPFDKEIKIKKDIELTNPSTIITIDLVAPVFNHLKNDFKYNIFTYSSSKFQNNNLEKNNILNILRNINEFKKMESIYIPNSITDIMFTGGSTGIHKGVDLDGTGLNYVVESSKKAYNFYPGMVYLGNIPVGYMCFGKAVMHMSLCNNLEFALTLKAMPNDFYEEIIRTRANCAAGGPPHWMSLISKDNDGFIVNPKVKKNSLNFLKYAGSGGEDLKQDAYSAINHALEYAGSKAKIGNGYGATEAWSCVILNTGADNTPGTLGNKMDCFDFKIVDPNSMKEVKKGESGLFLIRGKPIMSGYHNNEEETKKVFITDENGNTWFNTGDVICELENGEFKYIGRIKRNFVCGVENIYPEAIENLLIKLPEVREAVITKVSSDEKQYVPKYTISVYNYDFDIKEFEERLKLLVKTHLGVNWLPGEGKEFIEYTDNVLKKMSNSKIDISYYQAETDKLFSKSGPTKVLKKN